jgi:hypothetical protein
VFDPKPIVNIPGHLAIALTQELFFTPACRSEKRSSTFRALLAASLFPDIVDKTIGYVLQVMPNGRHYAHNVFSLAGSSLVVRLIWGKRAGSAWFVGYLGHLLADSQRPVPWFFPVVKYQFEKGRLNFDPVQLFRELILLGLVLVLRWSRR